MTTVEEIKRTVDELLSGKIDEDSFWMWIVEESNRPQYPREQKILLRVLARFCLFIFPPETPDVQLDLYQEFRDKLVWETTREH